MIEESQLKKTEINLAGAANMDRQERWNVSFCDEIDSEMTPEIIDELLAVSPFDSIDNSRFSGKITLRGILENDCRIRTFEKGEIVVRQGDWGNSAFFVLDGQLIADLESEKKTETSILGTRKPNRKSFLQRVAQLWNRPKTAEYRDVTKYGKSQQVNTLGDGKQTRIFLSDISQTLDDCKTAAIETGQFFGELSALGRCPRQATVVANSNCKLVEIRWQGLRDMMRNDQTIRTHIDSIFRERALKWFLLNTPIFAKCSRVQIDKLVQLAEFATYGQYDWAGSFKRISERIEEHDQNLNLEPIIANEGDHPNGLIIVRSGLARLTKKFENGHKTIGYLGPGQVFGVKEIAAGWKENVPGAFDYSLRSIGITTVVVIPTKVAEEILFSDELASRKLVSQNQQPSEFESINQDFVEFLVKKRIANGTATMLIDMDRCTRCDDCVKACAATHENNPRFLRNGPVQNNVMVANACMHCQDPVCMIECPTGAIHRDVDEGEVIINDNTCIGCTSCANNCPYDAIRMVDIRNRNGDLIRDSTSQLPILKATKCDLCFDQLGGPACQRACPHGALVRMNTQHVQSLADWFNR